MSADNKPLFKVVVEAGPNKDCEFAIPAAGARVGRSSQNDIALTDPLLSRHHCRFEMRGAELWVVDLASANQTLVNNKVIEENRLQVGDIVMMGDTVLRVLSMDGSVPLPPVVPAVAPAISIAATQAVPTDAVPVDKPVIDLGLDRRHEPAQASRNALRPILWSVAAVAVLALGAMLFIPGGNTPPPRKVVEIEDLTLQITYEKVEADPASIFRYEMTLSPENDIAIRIDDLKQDNHPRKELRIPDAERVKDLARELLASGFFKLDPAPGAYVGINPQPGVLNSWDLTIIVGRKAQHIRVVNRLEPEVFRSVRERIETFGKNELGIWAIQFSRDKLLELASETFRVGRKNYDEREIQYGNLFQAIKRFKEAEFYLSTVEPKPDFFADIADAQRKALEDLDRRYKDQNFRADRAINLQDWQAAQQELRILRELVPDRNDDRYKDATRKLIDVEARLKPRRK